MASRGHRARTHVGRRVLVPWSYLIGVCLIPGKLLWNRDPEEPGPALLAAVSILGVLRLGYSGLAPAAQSWELSVPLWIQLVELSPPLWFAPQVLCSV